VEVLEERNPISLHDVELSMPIPLPYVPAVMFIDN